MHKAKKVNVRNAIRLAFLAAAAAAAVAVYLLIHSHPEKPKLFHYILSLRIPPWSAWSLRPSPSVWQH